MTANRETPQAKAARYLAAGALTVVSVDGDRITATINADTGTYALGHHPRVPGGWWCGCPSRRSCAHIIALALVTAPAAVAGTVSGHQNLRPHEIAKRDQVLAAAADDAATPLHHVVVVDDAQPGTPCSLCDCAFADDNPASHDTGHCGGCPEPAEKIVVVEYRTCHESRAAVCAGHLNRALQIIRAAYERAYPDVTFGILPHPDWHDPE